MTLFDHALVRTQPVHIWHAEDRVETWSWPDVLKRSRAISRQMRGLGVDEHDVVMLMMPTSMELLACVLAAWSCRAAVCIAPHAIASDSSQLSRLKLNETIALLRPRLLVHALQGQAVASGILGQAAQTLGVQALAQAAATSHAVVDFPSAPEPIDVAVMQLTSGSTSAPKAVPLSHAQLLANVQSIRERVRVTDADHMVSWLPVYHDMGLAAVTVSLIGHAVLTLIPTERFVRNPLVWLHAISGQRATLSPAPAFAYGLLSKSVKRLVQGTVDLSSWRYAWIGAEPVSSRYLDAFDQAMQPHGLKPHVVQPAYGLAEAVVAVTGNGPLAPVRRVSIDGAAMSERSRVKCAGPGEPGAVTLVSNGKPITGAGVSIRRNDGSLAAPDEAGHVWISGPFVAAGYLGGVDAERFCDGWFDTGDIGFMLDGELYVSGRAKDLIIRGGVNTPPAHVEWIVEQALGLRPSRVVAFSNADVACAREEVVVVVALRPAAEERELVIQRIRQAVMLEASLAIDHVVFTAPNQIPKTTSGKVQRGAVRELYKQGSLGEECEVAA